VNCAAKVRGFDRKRSIQHFQPLLHADEAKPSTLFCYFGVKTYTGITDNKIYSIQRSPHLHLKALRAAVFGRIVERFLQNSEQAKRNVWRQRDGQIVDLSAKEFALLAYFIAHPVETLSRDRLLDAVWGYENYPTTRTVDTHIVHLRQKLEPNPEEPRFILTVHGSGYKFVG